MAVYGNHILMINEEKQIKVFDPITYELTSVKRNPYVMDVVIDKWIVATGVEYVDSEVIGHNIVFDTHTHLWSQANTPLSTLRIGHEM